jgi:hypothetical protein
MGVVENSMRQALKSSMAASRKAVMAGILIFGYLWIGIVLGF